MDENPSLDQELRVFVSSTFRDFQKERTILLNEVVPAVKRVARERGVEVNVVDLRWGLTDEQADFGGAIFACLREVEHCQPHFIGMIGERYGWCPSLQNLSADPRADDLSASVEEWVKAGLSMTAMEVTHGALGHPSDHIHAAFFFREKGLTESLSKTDSANGDSYLEIDEVSQAKCARLKKEIEVSAEKCGWAAERYSSLESFREKAEESLLETLDERFPVGAPLSEVERSQRENAAYARDRLADYIAPPQFLDHAFEELKTSRKILLTGPSGIGKSSATAALVRRFREEHPRAIVLEHYPGAAEGTTPQEILRKILSHFLEIEGRSGEIPVDEDKVREEIRSWLAQHSEPDRPVLIAIDALNQVDLRNRKGSDPKVWLPDTEQAGVYFITSSQPGAATKPLTDSKRWSSIDVPTIGFQERKEIVKRTLSRRCKELNPEQTSRIAAANTAATPLFLKVLLDELVVFGGLKSENETQDQFMDRQLDEYLRCEGAGALYEKMLDRLENVFGRDLVSEVLVLLSVSRSGLAEDELARIGDKKLLDIVRIRNALDYHVFSSSGFIRFAHEAINEAIRERYHEKRAEGVNRIIGYFASQPEGDSRQATELPWQLRRDGDYGKLIEYLSHPKVFDYFTGSGSDALYGDYFSYVNEVASLLTEDGQLPVVLDKLMRNFSSLHCAESAEALADRWRRLTHLCEMVVEISDHGHDIKVAENALDFYQGQFSSKDIRVADGKYVLAQIYRKNGKVLPSLRLFEESLPLLEVNYGRDHIRVAECLASIAELNMERGHHLDARELFSRSVKIYDRKAGETSIVSIDTLGRFGDACRFVGSLDQAENAYLEVVDRLKGLQDREPARLMRAMRTLAGCHAERGRYPEAESVVREALAILGQLKSEYREESNRKLATLDPHQRRNPFIRGMFLGWDSETFWGENEFVLLRRMLAGVLLDQGELDEAEPLFRSIMDHFSDDPWGHNELANGREWAKIAKSLARICLNDERYQESVLLRSRAFDFYVNRQDEIEYPNYDYGDPDARRWYLDRLLTGLEDLVWELEEYVDFCAVLGRHQEAMEGIESVCGMIVELGDDCGKNNHGSQVPLTYLRAAQELGRREGFHRLANCINHALKVVPFSERGKWADKFRECTDIVSWIEA